MEDNKIDQVIESLSRIEASAVGVQQDAEKKRLSMQETLKKKLKGLMSSLMSRHKKNLKS